MTAIYFFGALCVIGLGFLIYAINIKSESETTD